MSNSMISAPGVREAALVRVAPVGRFLILKDSTRLIPYRQATYPQVLIFSVDNLHFSVDNFGVLSFWFAYLQEFHFVA